MKNAHDIKVRINALHTAMAEIEKACGNCSASQRIQSRINELEWILQNPER